LSRRSLAVFLAALSLGVAACRQGPKSARSYEQIRNLVTDRTEVEVERLLGRPDLRQEVLVDAERWVWWNYTFLDGDQYAPELRGQVVHLEVTFESPGDPAGQPAPRSEWRASGPFAVSYSRPGNG